MFRGGVGGFQVSEKKSLYKNNKSPQTKRVVFMELGEGF